jgi:hypothetical protein
VDIFLEGIASVAMLEAESFSQIPQLFACGYCMFLNL